MFERLRLAWPVDSALGVALDLEKLWDSAGCPRVLERLEISETQAEAELLVPASTPVALPFGATCCREPSSPPLDAEPGWLAVGWPSNTFETFEPVSDAAFALASPGVPCFASFRRGPLVVHLADVVDFSDVPPSSPWEDPDRVEITWDESAIPRSPVESVDADALLAALASKNSEVE